MAAQDPPTPEELDPKTPGRPGHLPISEHAETFTTQPGVPHLPEGASPEEKDYHWYKHVYQGDRMPQLTFRAVAMGAILGMAMSISNLYTTMKVGWGFGVAITACVMSFVIWTAVRAISGGRVSQMSILENNCMQSTASAAGYSTGATIATCFGALLILTGQHENWMAVASFTLATGAMGVFLAIPMKRQMINQEQLPFPSGIAAATTLRSLYSEGAAAMRRAYSLVIAMFVAAAVGILNTGEDDFIGLGRFFTFMKEKLFNVHLPEQVPEAGFRTIQGKPLVGFAFEPSVMLIAAGMIVGLRVSLSMLLSSALLYFFITPYLAGIDYAQYGTPGYVVSIPLNDSGVVFFPVRWALWGGTAIMVFASLMSLALQWKTVVRSFTRAKAENATAGLDDATREKMAEIEVPNTWLIAGLVPITIAMLLVQLLAFHISLWAGCIAVGMSFVLSMVACRATGETDTTPIGAMGKVMQLIFAVLSPGNVTHNLVSAGTAANSASSSADLLTDLKSGYLLGANPRKQFIAQFSGIFFGTLAIVPAWYLMVPNKDALDKYPLPATQTWVAVAQVLSKGFESLPQSAIIAACIGAVIGCLLPILETLFPKLRPYLPSAMGLGLGWVVFFSNALAFTIGAIIAWAWQKINVENQESYNVPIASGLVAGESLMKALLAMLATAIGLLSTHAFFETKADITSAGAPQTAYVEVDRGDPYIDGKKLVIVKAADGAVLYRAPLGPDAFKQGGGLQASAGQIKIVGQGDAERTFTWDASKKTFIDSNPPRYYKKSYDLQGSGEPQKLYLLGNPNSDEEKVLVIDGKDGPLFKASLGTRAFEKAGGGYIGLLQWTAPGEKIPRLRAIYSINPWYERDFAWSAEKKAFEEVAPPHGTSAAPAAH